MTNIQKCMPMTDHFEGIDKLVKEAPHTDGAPNFRRVSESWSQMGLINPTSKLQPWLMLSHSRNLMRNAYTDSERQVAKLT